MQVGLYILLLGVVFMITYAFKDKIKTPFLWLIGIGLFSITTVTCFSIESLKDFSIYKYIDTIFNFNPDKPLLFTEFYFWAFFALVMIVFASIHNRLLMRSIFLFAVSLFFYWKTAGFFFLLLIFSTFIDYFIGKKIEDTETPWKRKALLTLSIVANLGTLIYFKYAFFFTDAYNSIFLPNVAPEEKLQVFNYVGHWGNQILGFLQPLFQWPAPREGYFRVDDILLPVGVSFFTFQTISYSVDVYRREIKALRNIFDFGFFVAYFPQLVAGPIVRANEFVPQIHKPYQLTKYEFGMAIFWILNGLIKKLILSDYLAVNFIDRVFDAPQFYGGFGNVLALLLYSLQVYADFSGYTDIAMGVSLMLGFRLPVNFNSPYKAANVTEFWKRWHMSLSTWLKDYLYIPLGGNKRASFGTWFWLAFITGFIFIMPGTIDFMKSNTSITLGIVIIYATTLFAILPRIANFILIPIFIFLLLITYTSIISIPSLQAFLSSPIIPWWLILSIAVTASIIQVIFKKESRLSFITNINMMLTMVIGGLWHGASWNFLIWGALNGSAMVVYKQWRKISPYEKSNLWVVHAWKVVITFVFISFTRLFFRAGDRKNANGGMDTVKKMWKEISGSWNWDASKILLETNYKVLLVFIAGMIIHWLPVSVKEWYRNAFIKLPIWAKIIVVTVIVFIVYQFITADLQTFVYFQF